MADNVLKSQAFKLKGRIYTFTVLQLISNNKIRLTQQLEEMVSAAPLLFNNTPVVLDCTQLNDQALDLDELIECLRVHSLLPVGIQSTNPLLCLLAQTRGIPVLHSSSTHDKSIDNQSVYQSISDENVSVLETQFNKLHTQPVRSGQQLVCKRGDLVIISSVSHGAELLADGNIHIYGALRGRALAGLSGDKNARIFCQSLEAELLSIAGFYRLSDAIEPHDGPCQIYLDEEERICIEPLC